MSESIITGLRNASVTTVSVSDKKGDVDIQIINEMTKLRRQMKTFPPAEKQKILVVLLSGDRDFAQQLKEFRDDGFRTMLFHAGKISLGVDAHADAISSRWVKVAARAGCGVEGNRGGSIYLEVGRARTPSPVGRSTQQAQGSIEYRELDIPNNKFGLVIANKNAEDWEKKYGIRLKIPSKGETKDIIISGTADDIKKCVAAMANFLNVVINSKPVDTTKWLALNVPQSKFGLAWANITGDDASKWTRKFNVKMNIPKAADKNADKNAKIKIAGKPGSISTCLIEMSKVMGMDVKTIDSDTSKPDATGSSSPKPRRSLDVPGGPGGSRPPSPGEQTWELDVPRNDFDHIFEQKSSWDSKHKVQISVPARNDPPSKRVTIKGSNSSVKSCVATLEAFLRRPAIGYWLQDSAAPQPSAKVTSSQGAAASAPSAPGFERALDVKPNKYGTLNGKGKSTLQSIQDRNPRTRITVPTPQSGMPVTLSGGTVAEMQACMRDISQALQAPVDFSDDRVVDDTAFESTVSIGDNYAKRVYVRVFLIPLFEKNQLADDVTFTVRPDLSKGSGHHNVVIKASSETLVEHNAADFKTNFNNLVTETVSVETEWDKVKLGRGTDETLKALAEEWRVAYSALKAPGGKIIDVSLVVDGDKHAHQGLRLVKEHILSLESVSENIQLSCREVANYVNTKEKKEYLKDEFNVRVSVPNSGKGASVDGSAGCACVQGPRDAVKSAAKWIEGIRVRIYNDADIDLPKRTEGMVLALDTEIDRRRRDPEDTSSFWLKINGKPVKIGSKPKSAVKKIEVTIVGAPSGNPFIDPFTHGCKALESIISSFRSKEFDISDAPTLEERFSAEAHCANFAEDHGLILVRLKGGKARYLNNHEIQFPLEKTGLLIGKGGAFVNTLKQDYPTVKIDIPKPNAPSGESIKVSGPLKDIQSCLQHISRNLKVKTNLVGSVDAGTPAMLEVSGEYDAVDNVLSLLGDMVAGARPETMQVNWPVSPDDPKYSWLKQIVPKHELSKLCDDLKAQFGQRALKTSIKTHGHGLIAISLTGPEGDVAQAKARADQVLEKKMRDAMLGSFAMPLSSRELKFLESNKYAKITDMMKAHPTVAYQLPIKGGGGGGGGTSGQNNSVIKTLTVGRLTVNVVSGSILNLDVAAITNAANNDLDHQAGVAGIIAKAAGAAELKLLGDSVLSGQSSRKVPDGGAVSTSSCKIGESGPIEYIIHAVAPRFVNGSLRGNDTFQRAVESTLNEASRNNCRSVALPLIGSGVFGWPVDLASTLVAETVFQWSRSSTARSSTLRKVVLVDIDDAKAQEMASAMAHVVDSGGTSAPAPLVSQHQWYWRGDGGWVPYDPDQNKQIESSWIERSAGNTNVKMVELMGDKGGVYSDSLNKPAGAQGAVYQVNFDAMHQMNVVSTFTRAVKRDGSPSATLGKIPDRSKLGRSAPASANKHGAGVQGLRPAPTPPQNKTRPIEITFFCAVKNDAAACARDIRAELDRSWQTSAEITVEDTEVKLGSILPGLGKLAEKLNAELTEVTQTSFKLRGLFLDDKNVSHVKKQMEAHLAGCLHEAREKLKEPPKTWVPQANSTSVADRTFDVAMGSKEWKDVERCLKSRGSFACTVVKVQRIQHPALWDEYAHARMTVAKRNNGDANELRDLKHGTGNTDPSVIIESDAGIDYRYSDWGMFGKGAYFAEETDYSDDGYVFKSGDTRQIFICRAVVGNVEERPVPDSNIRHPKIGYHSVRGVVRGIQYAYILYDNYRAYPEYLVEYKK